MELSFDDYLTQRIGLGRYQYQSFMILSMIEFMSGFQEIFVGILVRILKTEWNISETQQMVLGSVFYAGVMFGNSICSLLADSIGRRVLLLFSQSLTLLTILFNSWAQSYYQVIIALFLYGLLFGISMPISQVMISEVVPVKVRGRFIVLLQLIYIVGILYMTLCCYIFLDSFDKGDWRTLLRFNTIPASICLIGAFYLLRESPRLYIARGNFQEGFRELNHMGTTNSKSYLPIEEYEQIALIQWQKNHLEKQFQNVQVMGLLRGNNLRITLTIWGIFMSFNIISTGVQMITPYIYADSDSGFMAAFLAYGSEIFAIILVMVLIDVPKYGGRTNCTVLGLVLLIMVQMSIYYWQSSFIVVGLICQRFSIRIVWSCLNALPAEGYSTAFRAMGVGAAQGLGKASGMVSPFPMLAIYNYSAYLPFCVCAAMSLLTLLLVLTYPVNATQKQLDSQDQDTHIVHDQKEEEEQKDDDDIKINTSRKESENTYQRISSDC